MARDGTVSDSFCFWTNRGGVGKTTLCFHAATAYAMTHPNEQSIVVECDPQANLSSTLLTQDRTAGRSADPMVALVKDDLKRFGVKARQHGQLF